MKTRRPTPPAQRRYGPHHARLRARLMRAYVPGRTLCWRCRQPMSYPRGSRMIHLGHLDSGRGYGGLEHHDCNESAGGKASGVARRGGWDRNRVCGHCHTPFTARSPDDAVCGSCAKAAAKGQPPPTPSGRPW